MIGLELSASYQDVSFFHFFLPEALIESCLCILRSDSCLSIGLCFLYEQSLRQQMKFVTSSQTRSQLQSSLQHSMQGMTIRQQQMTPARAMIVSDLDLLLALRQ